MRYLIDTNIFLRLINGDVHLPKEWLDAFGDGSNEIFVSIISLWEIVIKDSIGKLPLRFPFAEIIGHALTHTNLNILPISVEHLTTLRYLPLHHRDPFDRLIIAQAISEGLTVATSDATFAKYDVSVLK